MKKHNQTKSVWLHVFTFLFCIGCVTGAGGAVPQPDKLLFSAVTDGFPESGAIGTWPCTVPATWTLAVSGGNPTVKKFGGVKWEKNSYSQQDAYRLLNPSLPPPPEGWMPSGYFTSSIPVNGASIVVAAKPVRNGIGDGWNSVVDIFYQRLVLGIRNNNGEVLVWRQNQLYGSGGTTIPDGQVTILSLVVQPNGQFKVYANGTEIMNVTETRDMTSLNPDFTADWGSNPWFPHYINVGRNQPDGWPTFNGYIGDIYVYTNALADVDRTALEADLTSKFITSVTSYNITASAGANGTVSPSGIVPVVQGYDKTFTITADSGYQIDQLLVDTVPVPLSSSYTFTDVSSDHSIQATFKTSLPYNIMATANAGGSITPSGSVSVFGGSSQTFTISADPGYKIANVLVDGVSQGVRVPSYTFSFVATNHTIDVIFTNISLNIPRSEHLLFSVITDDLPSSGNAGNWPTYIPSGEFLESIGTPTIFSTNGVKWENNTYMLGDGYRLGGAYAAPIPCNGATIITAVIPKRNNDSWWSSVVNIFFRNLMLNVRNTDGVVQVVRKDSWYDGPALPEGVPVILSAVVQPDGQLKLYTNGVEALSITEVNAYTQMEPGPAGHEKYINLGRNNPDGWSTYNGNIGDVFVYTMALSDAERQQVENIEKARFLPAPAAIVATISRPNVDGDVSITFNTVPGLSYKVEYTDVLPAAPQDWFEVFPGVQPATSNTMTVQDFGATGSTAQRFYRVVKVQ